MQDSASNGRNWGEIRRQVDEAAAEAEPGEPKKKRRVFLWVYAAIQALFIAWIVSGIVGAQGTPTDCGSLSAETCNAAADAGTAIGVALVVALWVVVDIIVGGSYAVYRLAKRGK